MLPVSTGLGGHTQSHSFRDQVSATRTGPPAAATMPLHSQPLPPQQPPLLQPMGWAGNGQQERSPSIVREIRILRSPEPVRQSSRPPKRSDASDDRTRRRRSRSRSTRNQRRRDRSPSRSRGRRRSAQSCSRSRQRRKKRSSSGSAQALRSHKSPVKPSVFSSAKELNTSRVENNDRNESGEATAEAIRLAQLKAASSLRVNAPPPPANMRPDDWFCPVCTTHNYASRNRCFRCNQGVNPGRGSSHYALGQR